MPHVNTTNSSATKTAAEPISFALPARILYSLPLRSMVASRAELISSISKTANREPTNSTCSTRDWPSHSPAGARMQKMTTSSRNASSYCNAALRPAKENPVAVINRDTPFLFGGSCEFDSFSLITGQ